VIQLPKHFTPRAPSTTKITKKTKEGEAEQLQAPRYPCFLVSLVVLGDLRVKAFSPLNFALERSAECG
jgi:hypothetical protein